MRTNLEFRSSELSEPASKGDAPSGQLIASLLAQLLPNQGFAIDGIQAEDWGWRVQVENDDFPLWIGCGAYQEFPDGCLCFIEPSQPFVRRWFKRIDTEATVERLADALEQALRVSGKASDLRWWTVGENMRG
jgi:hypothetical protein